MDQNISVDSLEDVPRSQEEFQKKQEEVAEVISAESVVASALAAVAASEAAAMATASEQATATPSTPGGDLSFGPALSGIRSFSQEGDTVTPPSSAQATLPEASENVTKLEQGIEQEGELLSELEKETEPEPEPEHEHLIGLKEEATIHQQSFQTAAGASFLVDPINDQSHLCGEAAEEMEFSKNYSDDLMGQSEGLQQHSTTAADLADFEMPAHSGSSSGSEATRQQQREDEQPKGERKSSSSRSTSTSSTAAQVPSSQSSYRATTTTSSSTPNLSAVRDLITSSYSRVSHVFQWEHPLETGIIFGIGLTIITTLTFFSIISVFAYSALGVILTSAMIRLYKAVCKTLNRSSKTPFDHVWERVLGLNVTFSPEKMHHLIDTSLNNLNASLVYFKQVLLFEDKYSTFKFGAFMYVLTYLGAWFNGMTLITITYLALFSGPILYQKNKTNIDQYLKLANGHISSTLSKVTNRASSLVSTQTTHQD